MKNILNKKVLVIIVAVTLLTVVFVFQGLWRLGFLNLKALLRNPLNLVVRVAVSANGDEVRERDPPVKPLL